MTGNWEFLPTCGQKCKNEYLRILKTEIWTEEKKREVNKKVSAGVIKSNTPEKLKLQIDNLKASLAINGAAVKEQRRNTSLERHGDPTYSNPKTASATRKAFTAENRKRVNVLSNKTKEKRYGFCKMSAYKMLKYKDPEYWKPIVESIRNTCRKKYGQKWLPMKMIASSSSSGPVSKVERRFIQMIVDTGVVGMHCFSKDGQWSIRNTERSFFFDFAIPQNKKLIEFNGDFWHANPKKYKQDDVIKVGKFSMTAKQLWLKDQKKIEEANKQGYEILTIWESDFYKNPSAEVEKCINWLAE